MTLLSGITVVLLVYSSVSLSLWILRQQKDTELRAVKVWIVLSSPVSPEREWCFQPLLEQSWRKRAENGPLDSLSASVMREGRILDDILCLSTQSLPDQTEFPTRQLSVFLCIYLIFFCDSFISLSRTVCFFEPIKSFSVVLVVLGCLMLFLLFSNESCALDA